MERENIIQIKSFDFALLIIELYKELISQKEYVISKQILRSGTSIGANVEEAIGAYSKADFTHKMCIALKEVRETRYWLRLLLHSDLLDPKPKLPITKVNEIISILTSIVKTLQTNNS